MVEKLPERMRMAFPLLTCLRTHYGRHCEPFSDQNALDCSILHIQSQIFSRGGGDTPRLTKKRPRCSVDRDINFCLARQHFHCSCFTKRPLRWAIMWRLKLVPEMTGYVSAPSVGTLNLTQRKTRWHSAVKKLLQLLPSTCALCHKCRAAK